MQVSQVGASAATWPATQTHEVCASLISAAHAWCCFGTHCVRHAYQGPASILLLVQHKGLLLGPKNNTPCTGRTRVVDLGGICAGSAWGCGDREWETCRSSPWGGGEFFRFLGAEFFRFWELSFSDSWGLSFSIKNTKSAKHIRSRPVTSQIYWGAFFWGYFLADDMQAQIHVRSNEDSDASRPGK